MVYIHTKNFIFTKNSRVKIFVHGTPVNRVTTQNLDSVVIVRYLKLKHYLVHEKLVMGSIHLRFTSLMVAVRMLQPTSSSKQLGRQ